MLSMKRVFGFLNKQPGPTAHAASPLVNLGCGAHFHPAWINLDVVAYAPGIIQHDLRTRLPFADASCAVVYHSHVLEHFSRAFAPEFLKECYRILAPGGILRVVVPDLETITRLYLKYLEGALAGEAQAAQRYEWMTLELLDQMVRDQSGGEMLKHWQQNPMPAEDFVVERTGQEVRRYLEHFRQPAGKERAAEPRHGGKAPTPEQVAQFRASGEVHQWMYDRYSLRVMLERAGFSQVKVCAAHESSIPNFNSFRLDFNADGSIRKPDSLFMEGRKPVTAS